MRLFDSDPDKAREELNSLKASASTTFAQVRDYIFDLRPMMLDDLGVIPTIRRYVDAYKDKTGMDLSVVVTGSERRLEAHREVLVFRTVQALLANVREHAQATQAKVLLDIDEGQVRTTVEDNGKGFDVESALQSEDESGGLLALSERVEQVGGEMEIESAAGEGTRVSFWISAD